MTKIVGVIIAAIVVIGLVFYFMADDTAMNDMNSNNDIGTMEEMNDQGNQNNTNTNTNTGTNNTTPANSVVLSPAETGNFARVQSATLLAPGYVVIYRVNSNSDTSVLGSSELLEAGTYSDLSIQLDSPIVREQTVVAVLHEDDGDGEFEFPGSDTYLGNSNQAVVSDVDVVDVKAEDEDEVLQEQVELFLENNAEMSEEDPA